MDHQPKEFLKAILRDNLTRLKITSETKNHPQQGYFKACLKGYFQALLKITLESKA